MPATIRLLLLASLATACSPTFDNPFDPANAGEGGPLRLTLDQVGFGAVRVRWTAVPHDALTGYTVERTALTDASHPEESTAIDVDATTTEWVDDAAVGPRAYRYRLVARAGDERSDPGPALDIAVPDAAGPPISAEHTGIGAVTVRWDEPAPWIREFEVLRRCADTECAAVSLGVVDAATRQLTDDLDEGPTVYWEAVAVDRRGVRLEAKPQRTGDLHLDRKGPFPTNWRRALEAPTTITVRFDPEPDAAGHAATAIRADDTGAPVVATATSGEVTLEGLDESVSYRITLVAVGPNGKHTLPSDPIWVDARRWVEFEPERGLLPAPTGSIPALALWSPDGSSEPRLLALAGTPSEVSLSDVAVAYGDADLERRGGFRSVRERTLGAFAPPWVAVGGEALRWVSPVSGVVLTPDDPEAGVLLVTGGNAPEAELRGAAATVNPADGTIWQHGGALAGTSDTLRRGVLSGNSLQWTTVAMPSLPRLRHAMAWHEGMLYFLGGDEEEFGLPAQSNNFRRLTADGQRLEAVPQGTGGPTTQRHLALVSDGEMLWAAGGEGLPQYERRVWSWSERKGWIERSLGAEGPRPSGTRWAVVPHVYSHGPGLLVYDGVDLFEFRPENDQLQHYVWRRLDAPPPSEHLRGTYDVQTNAVYLANDESVWRYEPGYAGYERLAGMPPGFDAGSAGFTYDDAQGRLFAYAGGNVVFGLDPNAAQPAFTVAANPAGGPAGLAVQVAKAGVSVADFETPTLYAVGRNESTGGPQQVWSVALSGASPWARVDTGTGPVFAAADACSPRPVSCWDPSGPVVYSVGTRSGDSNGIDVWSLDLVAPSPAWTRVVSTTFPRGCMRIEAVACAHNERALYVTGRVSGKAYHARIALETKTWQEPAAIATADTGLRSLPLLVYRPSWDDLLLFGGRASERHDVWQLVTR